MQRPLALAMFATLLAGCPQDVFPVGFDMSDFYQFSNGRQWTYSTLNAEVDYVIDARMDPARTLELDNGDTATIITYEKRCLEGVEDCGAGFMYDLYMSETSVYGVAIHGYENPTEGKVLFENRLLIAPPKMARGDSITSTDVQGHTFTSTFFDIEEDGETDADGNPIAEELGCDQDVGVVWECAHFTIESDPPGHWLAGDWWTAAGWNTVAWKRTDDIDKWRTIDADLYEGGGDTDDTDETDATDDTDSQ